MRWLVDDQREFSGRTDVLTFTSDVLTKPMTMSGEPMVHLMASTTGTDADWVVKLIDVYPDEVAGQPELGGYQLPIAMDILRGRYRESLSEAKAITPNHPLDLQVGAADDESCVSAGAPDYGAGAVELVPAVRPQSTDVCAEHLLCEAGGL